jgi:hypothetical protein
MSFYVSEYPSVDFDPAIKRFYEDFYYISDTPDAHEKYVQQFTKDATLIMASKTAKGHESSSFSFYIYACPLDS